MKNIVSNPGISDTINLHINLAALAARIGYQLTAQVNRVNLEAMLNNPMTTHLGFIPLKTIIAPRSFNLSVSNITGSYCPL